MNELETLKVRLEEQERLIGTLNREKEDLITKNFRLRNAIAEAEIMARNFSAWAEKPGDETARAQKSRDMLMWANEFRRFL